MLLLIASGKPGFDLSGGLAATGYAEHSPGGFSLLAPRRLRGRLGAGPVVAAVLAAPIVGTTLAEYAYTWLAVGAQEPVVGEAEPSTTVAQA